MTEVIYKLYVVIFKEINLPTSVYLVQLPSHPHYRLKVTLEIRNVFAD